jgi:hypothetical protein
MIDNVDQMMTKTYDKNLVSKLWMKIKSSPIMAHKLSEYIKLQAWWNCFNSGFGFCGKWEDFQQFYLHENNLLSDNISCCVCPHV